MSTRSSFLYIESESEGFDLHFYLEGTDGETHLEIVTKDVEFNCIIPKDVAGELKKQINRTPKKEGWEVVDKQFITTICDGLEEMNASGLGYDQEAADFLIAYLSERGYEFKDVIPEKAAI